MRATNKLRKLLEGNEIIVAPGVWDGISAKVMERAGFPSVAISGFALEASALGHPDVGLTSFGEMLDRGFRIASAVDIPVIIDGETGFGGPIQVTRIIKDLEKAGLAGIHIEDQVNPKKCGSLLTKSVIPVPEAVAKIKAAVDARTDPDFIIIARTDADVISFDAVVERCNLFLEAGADVAFPINAAWRKEGPEKLAEVTKRLPKQINGPVMIGSIDLAEMTAEDAQAAGVKIVTYFSFALFAATQAMMDAARELKSTGIPSGYFKRNPGISQDEFFDFIGLPEVLEMEKKYIY